MLKISAQNKKSRKSGPKLSLKSAERLDPRGGAAPSQPQAQRAEDGEAKKTGRPVGSKFIAGWSSPVARQAHNLKVTGSNPVPATKSKAKRPVAAKRRAFCVGGDRQ